MLPPLLLPLLSYHRKQGEGNIKTLCQRKEVRRCLTPRQASFVCEFIECLTCSNGAPFRLMDWQRDAVTEFYGQMIEAEGDEADPAGSYIRRYQYLYLEIAKKNGKSRACRRAGRVPPVRGRRGKRRGLRRRRRPRQRGHRVFGRQVDGGALARAHEAQPHRGQHQDHLRHSQWLASSKFCRAELTPSTATSPAA